MQGTKILPNHTLIITERGEIQLLKYSTDYVKIHTHIPNVDALQDVISTLSSCSDFNFEIFDDNGQIVKITVPIDNPLREDLSIVCSTLNIHELYYYRSDCPPELVFQGECVLNDGFSATDKLVHEHEGCDGDDELIGANVSVNNNSIDIDHSNTGVLDVSKDPSKNTVACTSPSYVILFVILGVVCGILSTYFIECDTFLFNFTSK